jgi:tetratricopeptide (TPR) repeat protein
LVVLGYVSGNTQYDIILEYYNGAIKGYQTAKDTINSSLYTIYTDLAYVYNRKKQDGDYQKSLYYALKGLNIINKLNPDEKRYYNRAYTAIASAYLSLKQLDSALIYHKKVIFTDRPEDISSQYKLAEIYSTRKEYKQADSCFKMVIKNLPLSDNTPFEKSLKFRDIGEFYKDIDSLELSEKLILAGLSIADTLKGVVKKGLYSFYGPLALISYNKKDYERSLFLYKKAYELIKEENPSDPYRKNMEEEFAGLYLAIGFTYSDRKEYLTALEYYSQAKKIAPNLGYIYYAQAEVLSALNRKPEAFQAYRVALKMNKWLSGSFSFDEQLNILIKYAFDLKLTAHYDSAKAYFTQIMTLTHSKDEYKKKYVIALVERANCEANLKEYSKEIIDYKEADSYYTAAKDKALIYNNIGAAYQAIQKHDSASIYFSKTIELDNNTSELKPLIIRGYQLRANNYHWLKNYLSSINDYQKVILLDTSERNRMEYIGRVSDIYMQINQFDSAKVNLKKLISMSRSTKNEQKLTAKAYYHLGYCQYQQKDYSSACSDYYIALGLDSTSTMQINIYSDMSLLYMDLYRYDSVAICNQRLISLSENMPAYQASLAGRWSVLGVALDRTGRYKEAILVHTRYRDLANSQTAQTLFDNNIGMSYLGLGDLEKAKSHFTKFEASQSDVSRIARNWSLYYSVSGQPDLALDYLRKAISLGYNDWWFIKNDKRFETIRKEAEFDKILKSASTPR